MSKAFDAALRCLIRREHSAYELAQKLTQKGYETLEIQDAIKACQRLGLQSDLRFVESLCRTRIRQGYGPQKITHDLQQVRIEKELIDSVLSQESHDWLSHAKHVLEKKYPLTHDQSYKLLQKQKQFLLYRGFFMDTIHQVFKELTF